MSDFTRRLADRYEHAREDAELSNDELGVRVFTSAERLVRAMADQEISMLPDEETLHLVETAIIKQKKWSPDEVRPKWGMALSILNDEKVSLSLAR